MMPYELLIKLYRILIITSYDGNRVDNLKLSASYIMYNNVINNVRKRFKKKDVYLV